VLNNTKDLLDQFDDESSSRSCLSGSNGAGDTKKLDLQGIKAPGWNMKLHHMKKSSISDSNSIGDSCDFQIDENEEDGGSRSKAQ